MEEDKDTQETPTRGNEWEVVSLTASAYAAAPGPAGFESIHDDQGNESSRDVEEATRALFMSGHFVFPPSEHENLPFDPIDNEIHVEHGSELVHPNISDLGMEEGDKSEKSKEENWTFKGMKVPEEVHGIQFYEEKEKYLSGHDTEFGAGKALQGLNLVEEEQTIYSALKLSSLLDEAECEDFLVIPEPNVSAETNSDSSSDSAKSQSPKNESKRNGSGLPCEAWWKRQAASFYAQAKEANAFWSVFVAAALMGIVILGQRWQQERWQAQQKWHFSINDEKMNRMMGSLSRFKDVIVGGHRRGSIIRDSASAER
ncbi:hypothetical protein IFM89_015450 [Coptis chinensis]|uniref:ATG8-interacting protein 1 n=1 Tax=Coptis chinensis TaxID=261450 RepID=A0A835IA99_9MAGN|nr:hypothetical protein IFM89_015450 [Coptis chinensis]